MCVCVHSLAHIKKVKNEDFWSAAVFAVVFWLPINILNSVRDGIFFKAYRSVQGVDVYEIVIRNGRGLSLKMCTYGATITGVQFPDRLGNTEDITLGQTLEVTLIDFIQLCTCVLCILNLAGAAVAAEILRMHCGPGRQQVRKQDKTQVWAVP